MFITLSHPVTLSAALVALWAGAEVQISAHPGGFGSGCEWGQGPLGGVLTVWVLCCALLRGG